MSGTILCVSFGCSDEAAANEYILPVENALAHAFPRCQIRRAYSSRHIIEKLRRSGVEIASESEWIAQLRSCGETDIKVASTCIIAGNEYTQMVQGADGCPVSEPLLACEADIEWMTQLLARIAAREKRPLLLMGHGAAHAADHSYQMLRQRLPENVFLACLSGENRLDTILPQLQALPEKRIALMPLMLVYGMHAREMLEGRSETSWRSILEKLGFDVQVCTQALGALPEVQQRYAEKAQKLFSL